MFTQNFKNKIAFSLIELLVSLIIISLLIAAFMPLITKKIKANDITVGSFGNNNTTVDGVRVKRDVTKQDCDKFNALYIPTEMNGGIRPVCATKWNMGDNGLPLSNNIDALDVGDTCTSNNCCFQGNTAGEYSTGKNGTYSGQNRTVCTWEAANNNCLSYAPNGTKKGDWRLPTKIEIDNWQINSLALNAGKGNDGLQFCSGNSLTNLDLCYWVSTGCNNSSPMADTRHQSSRNYCHPYAVWTSTPDYTYAQNYYALSESSYDDYSTIPLSKNFAYSNRCVLDSISEQVNGIECNCENGTCEDNIPFCTSCNEGYILENHKCVLDDGLDYREPNSQKDCDITNSLFIDKKYLGTNKNICMMRYNLGDGISGKLDKNGFASFDIGYIYVPSEITSNNPLYTCWQGYTAEKSGAPSTAFFYTGSARTVCTWNAANHLCTYWNSGNTRQGYWRLLTEAETLGLVNSLNNETKTNNPLNRWNMEGLQLCSVTDLDGVVTCTTSSRCKNQEDNVCFPAGVWAGQRNPKNSMEYRYLDYNGTSAGSYYMNRQRGLSVRCVTDKVLK